MDQAFHVDQRLWIGTKYVGRKQLEFLHKWSQSMRPPSLDDLNKESEEEPTEEEEATAENVEEVPQVSPSNSENSSKEVVKETCRREESIRKYVESFGDEFFGVPKTVIKRNRRRKRNEQEEDENVWQELVVADDEGDSLFVTEDNKVAEDSENCFIWRNPKDYQLEDQQGQVIEEDDYVDDDDEWSSFDEESAHETEEDDDEDNANPFSDEGIDSNDNNNLCEGLRQYMGLGFPAGLTHGLRKHRDIDIEEELASDSNSHHSDCKNIDNNADDVKVSFDDVKVPFDDVRVSFDSDSHYSDDDDDVNIVYEDLVNSADDHLVMSADEDEIDMVSPVSANNDGHGSIPNVAASPNENDNNKEDTPLAIANVPDDSGVNEEYWDNLQEKLWKGKRSTMDPKKKAQLRKMLSMDNEELDFFRSCTEFTFDEMRRMPFVDKPIVVDGLMPIMAPPIPQSVLTASLALSTYANFSTDPGPFQWRCKAVNEQVANSLDYDLRRRKLMEAKQKWDSDESRENFVSDGDAVFTVVLYHQSATNQGTDRRLKEPQMAVTVEVLARQTLNDLRSKFYCKNEHIEAEIKGNPLTNKDSVVSPGACLRAMEKNMDKPCGIFVGDTMYINKSSKEQDDNYSEALNRWCEANGSTRKKVAGPFKEGSMENTKMMDLVFRHGFPYLFVHQGNCEHLMVIENATMVQPLDYLLKADFPRVIKSNFRTLYCQVDNTRIARFVIRKSDWFPQDPMLLCPECLDVFLCNENETSKLYHFHQIASLF